MPSKRSKKPAKRGEKREKSAPLLVNGKFAKGNIGGPGRPRLTEEERLVKLSAREHAKEIVGDPGFWDRIKRWSKTSPRVSMWLAEWVDGKAKQVVDLGEGSKIRATLEGVHGEEWEELNKRQLARAAAAKAQAAEEMARNVAPVEVEPAIVPNESEEAN